MPHITLEYSPNFLPKYIMNIGAEIQNIMRNINLANFDVDQCKIRSIPYQNFIVGLDENRANFIHISIKILAGRSLEIRKELSKKVFDYVVESYEKNSNNQSRTDISVDIIEMDRDCYNKITIK